MTNSEHAAISAQLAFSIGWTTYHVGDYIHVDSPTDREPRVFDYRDPTVYGPLIEWLMSVHDCELRMYGVVYHVQRYSSIGISRSLPEAVARAVIAVKGQP